MPFSNIDKGSNYFDTNLYTGNNTARNITLNFSPDFVWIRSRDTGGTNHFLQDSVRGTSKIMYSNSTSAEVTFTDGYVSSFNSDGYSLTTDTTGYMNYNARTYVGWSWRGSDSSAVSNTSGTITSTVSANTTSGFSIVSYTANASTTATIGHGLGFAPSMIIVKERSGTADWMVYHKSLGAGNSIKLNSTGASASNTVSFGNTSPTSTLFTIGEDGGDYQTNYPNGATYIAYCFAEVKGFSKAFSYTGNGSTDGTFVYLGFRPAYVLIKYTSGTGQDWYIWDNKRVTYNPNNNIQTTNTNQADTITSVVDLDILSNGFKCRNTNGGYNASGGNYIGIAFAENPFVTSKGIPVTAK